MSAPDWSSLIPVLYRPHVHVTKCEMDNGRKSGYHAAILSGKNDYGLRSIQRSCLQAPFSPAQEVIYIYSQNAQGLNWT